MTQTTNITPGIKTLSSVDPSTIKGKRVLVRVDFNVPMQNGVISDDSRIKAALPTIRFLLKHQAKIILASHFGRPKGKVVPAMSLQPVVGRLSILTGAPVIMAPDCIGPEVKVLANHLQDGTILLLENVRFHKEETDNDTLFTKQLASLADIYIQDAFSAAHRNHASSAGIGSYLPSYAGFLMEKEINFLINAIQNPKRPIVTIIGGAKVSTKIGVLKNLLNQVDILIIGGAMTFTFFKAQGLEIGKSLCEDDYINEAKLFLEKAKTSRAQVIFPDDHVVVSEINENAKKSVVNTENIREFDIGVDVGPKTIKRIQDTIQNANTIIWNGPLGIFEIDGFSTGTTEVAKAVAASDAISIIGGGDSTAAIIKAGLADKITHVSTGGGASLELLEGKRLPGITIVRE